MDSLTQLALGACVGVAGLGRAVGPRKAALVGAVLGTLPDLDVFIPHGDPIDDFVLHRGFSHSLLVHAALTPLFGEAVHRWVAGLEGHRLRTWLTVFFCLATHALLDALTIYGTQLFWPLWRAPLSVGSTFIIDPLYTAPLLLALAWAGAHRRWTPASGRASRIALAVSTGYLGWGLWAQQAALAAGERRLAAAGIEAERALATPTPFNSLLWRVIAIDGERYFNLYVPVVGASGDLPLFSHRSGAELAACLESSPAFHRLAAFTKGFYRLDLVGDEIVVADLRMGLTPDYVFQFAVARREGAAFQPTAPRRVPPERRSAPGDLDWLLAGLFGAVPIRPAEAAAVAVGPPPEAPPSTCRG